MAVTQAPLNVRKRVKPKPSAKRKPSRKKAGRKHVDGNVERIGSRRVLRATTYNDLCLLRDLLNLDFNALNQGETKNELRYFVSFYGVDSSKESAEMFMKLQADILADIGFITDDKSSVRDIEDRFHFLIARLNAFDFRYKLACEKVRGELPPVSFGPNQRIFTLKRTRWLIRTVYTPTLSVPEYFYSIVARSLENGTLADLKKCPECRGYFLRLHGNQKLCVKCANERESKAAKERVKHHRERLRKAKADFLKTKGMQTLNRLMILARNEKRSVREDDEIFSIDNEREIFDSVESKIKKKPTLSSEEMWDDLPKSWQKILGGTRQLQ